MPEKESDRDHQSRQIEIVEKTRSADDSTLSTCAHIFSRDSTRLTGSRSSFKIEAIKSLSYKHACTVLEFASSIYQV